MVKFSRKTSTKMKFKVDVTWPDIAGGVSCKASKCMHKVAIARTLDNMDRRGGHHKVRVDAGHIKFNYGGYRWEAKTPKIAKDSLMRFDDGYPVQPHSYTVNAERTSKIIPLSAERQEQINKRRRERVENEGYKQKPYLLRDRIRGYDSGHGG